MNEKTTTIYPWHKFGRYNETILHGSLITNMTGFVIKISILIMQAAIKMHFVHWGGGGGGGGEEVDFKIRLSPRTLLSLAYFYHWYLLPASLMKIRLKNEVTILRTTFSPLCQWELLVAMETRVLIGSIPKCLLSLFPTPMMLHITLDQDWPTFLRGIQVWKCWRTICKLL